MSETVYLWLFALNVFFVCVNFVSWRNHRGFLPAFACGFTAAGALLAFIELLEKSA